MVMVVDGVFGMSPFPPTTTNCTESAVTLCVILHKVAPSLHSVLCVARNATLTTAAGRFSF